MAEKGIILVLVVISLVSGCITSAPPEVKCEVPYIPTATGCCLDKNSNGLCDLEETTTTMQIMTSIITTIATTISTTTSTTSTTTINITTTTSIPAECVKASDCGERYFSNLTCVGSEEVIKYEYIPLCKRGKCVYKADPVRVDFCGLGRYCVQEVGCVMKNSKYINPKYIAELEITPTSYNVTFWGYKFNMGETLSWMGDVPWMVVIEVQTPEGRVMKEEMTTEVMIGDLKINRINATKDWMKIRVEDTSKYEWAYDYYPH